MGKTNSHTLPSLPVGKRACQPVGSPGPSVEANDNVRARPKAWRQPEEGRASIL